MSRAREVSRVFLRGSASIRALSGASRQVRTNAVVDVCNGQAEASAVRNVIPVRLYATIPGIEMPSPEIPVPPTTEIPTERPGGPGVEPGPEVTEPPGTAPGGLPQQPEIPHTPPEHETPQQAPPGAPPAFSQASDTKMSSKAGDEVPPGAHSDDAPTGLGSPPSGAASVAQDMPNEAPGQAPPGAPGEEATAPGKSKDIPSDAMFEQSGASTVAPPKGPIGSAPEQGALNPGDMPKPKTGQV